MRRWMIDRLPSWWVDMNATTRVGLFCLAVAVALAFGHLWYVAGLVAIIGLVAFIARAILPD